MENSAEGQNSNPEGAQPQNNRGIGFIDNIKRKLHQRKAKKEHENPVDRAARITAKATVWIATFTVVMALVGVGTLYEIIEEGKDTHDLAVAAGKQAEAAGKQADRMKDFADRMKDQTDRTKDLADRMKDQADRTKTIAEQAVVQANAAKDASDTAKKTLHISERAYLMLSIPVDDFSHKRISVPIINVGHVPSGLAKITVHEATFRIDDPSAKIIPSGNVVEKHWMQYTYQDIPITPTGLIDLEIHLPAVVEDDIKNGRQGMAIAAILTYNDGFPKTPEQTFIFCDASNYRADTKLFTMRPCDDPTAMLRTLTTLDEYPKPTYQEK